jgi:heme/copper-type cytochrome/quinol oxidase subunit 2
MEGIFIFNSHLLTVIVGIIVLVGWLMLGILSTHLEIESSTTNPLHHSNLVEIIWTTIPALVLLSLASPSLSLLYGFIEICEKDISVKIFGHQWYWRYEIGEANFCDLPETVKFATYVLGDEWLCLDKSGLKRTLEVNRRLVLPTAKNIQLCITGVDVLHSWTIPSFGVKVDACPGRLSYMSLFIKRSGLFFGQCSEICGVNHGFMPVSALVLPANLYKKGLTTFIKDITHL